MKLELIPSVKAYKNLIILCEESGSPEKTGLLDPEQIRYFKTELKKERSFITYTENGKCIILQTVKPATEPYKTAEAMRRAANKAYQTLCDLKATEATVISTDTLETFLPAYAEGMMMSSYQFLKYKKDGGKSLYSLRKISIAAKKLKAEALKEVTCISGGNFLSRDLVNEPLSYLTATKFSEEIRKAGKDAGMKVTVFDKKKIETLKMGGILAVNKGSVQPPTFNIIEYKPAKAVNKKPYVLVGKGVVYDTGGLSLKPTPNSMDYMKCDMGGAAAVVGAMYAVAKMKLPVHIIGLIPATDNRPGGDAYVPGDVIRQYDGTTVEVLNTDAEGRLILADALSYAKQYKPELVIDLATLTGAAAAAVGAYGIVCMGTASEAAKNQLKESGNNTYERLVEFPIWDEYAELIRSDIADLKNIGGPVAGAITAGKFLQHFTDYPWMHFDIAAPAYLHAPDSYRGKNGTGVGVRLLYDFFKKVSKSK